LKIYTKTGDKGTTSLFGGTRVSKDHVQIEAYGTVDELNSHIGLLISQIQEFDILNVLKPIQPTLFDIGSHLASDGKADDYLPEINQEWVELLEIEIDRQSKLLPELKNFVMPGGNQRIAVAHLCRTICRRAERRVIALSEFKKLDKVLVIYLNRLSDYFFSLSRYLCVLDNVDEVKWNPK